MSSLANEEPLGVMKACVDIVGKVIGQNGCNGSDHMIRDGETSLCRSRNRGIGKGVSCTQNRDIGCGGRSHGHRGSEVFSSWGSDKNIIRVDGDILVKRREEESVEKFLGDTR